MCLPLSVPLCSPLSARSQQLLCALQDLPWFTVVLSLAGPALVHAERAQAGERPALLQTVQRQPAPRHCEVIVTALDSAIP